ncbi:SDR family oxidoreductase [Polaromonas sp. P1(28)-8]|nr:SDR family oxidoreductase [Polaromonas sp. P1(28)-8]
MRTSSHIVVVNGAAGGIGAAICRRFIHDGATTIGVDRDSHGLARLSNEFNAGAFTPFEGDITNEADIGRLHDLIRDREGRLDVLINNAGYFPVHAFEAITLAEWRQVTAVNLDSVFLLSFLLLPLLKASGRGRIINIASASVFRGVAGQSHYVAAKAGVVGLSKSLVWELAPHGIHVNVVTPGLTATGAPRKSLGSILKKGKSMRAMQCELLPEYIVGAMAFLASEDADYMTGQIVNVDGGSTMH